MKASHRRVIQLLLRDGAYITQVDYSRMWGIKQNGYRQFQYDYVRAATIEEMRKLGLLEIVVMYSRNTLRPSAQAAREVSE